MFRRSAIQPTVVVGSAQTRGNRHFERVPLRPIHDVVNRILLLHAKLASHDLALPINP